jgi:hypothetical protein
MRRRRPDGASLAALAMPPDAVAIKEPDVRTLVGWILGLGPQR